MRVVFLDTDKELYNYITLIIESGFDCQLSHASSLGAVKDSIRDGQVDAIISESKFQGKSTASIYQLLREHNPSATFLLLSHDDYDDLDDFEEFKADLGEKNLYLKKPIKDNDFFEILERFLPEANENSFAENDQKTENPFAQYSSQTSTSKSDESLDYAAMKSSQKKQYKEDEEGLNYAQMKAARQAGKAGGSLDYDQMKQSNHRPGEDDSLDYSQMRDSGQHSGAEDSLDYSQMRDSGQNSGAEDTLDYSQMKDSGQHSGAEDTLDYSQMKDSGQHSGTEDSLDYSQMKDSDQNSKAESNLNNPSIKNNHPPNLKHTDQQEDPEENLENKEELELQELCRVNIKRFLQFKDFDSEIFIQLPSSRLIKIKHREDTYDNDLITKYMGRGVKWLYIKESAFKKMTEEISYKIASTLNQDKLTEDSRIENQIDANQFIYEQIEKIGITQSAVDMINSNIQSTLKAVNEDYTLLKLLNKMKKSNGYIYNHGLMMSYVAVEVAKKLDWGSTQMLEKICFVCLLHDCTLTSDNLARIDDLSSQEFKNLSNSEQEKVKNHMYDVARITKKIENLPPDVEIIFEQHHEKPDGTGFPKGLDSHQILPIACLIILVENFVQYMFDLKGEEIEFDKVFVNFKSKYNKGNFKKVLAAFKETFMT